jgi:hypothetical protein
MELMEALLTSLTELIVRKILHPEMKLIIPKLYKIINKMMIRKTIVPKKGKSLYRLINKRSFLVIWTKLKKEKFEYIKWRENTFLSIESAL